MATKTKKRRPTVRTAIPSVAETARILGIPRRSEFVRRAAETFATTIDIVYSLRIAGGRGPLVELDPILFFDGPTSVLVDGRKVAFRYNELDGRVVIQTAPPRKRKRK